MQQLHETQVSVHDWIGKTVWTREQGHLCPPLERPEPGQTVLYVDYRKDLAETLVQATVELAIDALGYPAGSRYIGDSSLDPDAVVVSYVGTFPSSEVASHREKLLGVVPIEVLMAIEA